MIGAPQIRRRALLSPGPTMRPLAPPGTAECRRCERRVAEQRWEAGLRVCSRCGHHERVPAALRCRQIGDAGACAPVELPTTEHDPLDFDDGVSYRVRQARLRTTTETQDAFVVARAAIGGTPAVVASMEFGFLGGSLGRAAGEAFATACQVAVDERRALVAVCVSGGARMQEGIVSLAQMARCTTGTAAVAAARLPYVSILADPCFGGVTASFATQADVIVAEPGARIGFAGGRVIEQATHERLPEGFQTAEFMLAHGLVDAIVPRPQLHDWLARVLLALSSGARPG